MRFLLACIFIALSFTQLFAQEMKALDFTAKFKKNRVHSQTIREIYYTGNQAVDTLLIGKVELDSLGRMCRYEEYFARGRKFAVTTVGYDEGGRMISQQISTMSSGFLPVNVELTFDKTGRLVERMIPGAPSNLWYKEKLVYNKEGVMIRTEKWYLVDGQEIKGQTEEYPGTNARTEESASELYDPKGLPLLRKKFSPSRGLNFSVVYEYDYY